MPPAPSPPLSAWGLSGAPEALAGGFRNTVLRVGDHVLKTTRRSEAAITWLLPVLHHAGDAGLIVPALRRAGNGCFVVDGWTCEPYLPGAPTSPSVIAAKVQAMHAALRDWPQRPGFASARDLCTRDCGGDIDLGAMPAALVRRLRAAWAKVPSQRTVVHGDLNAQNILTDASGRHVLIDWDEARCDAPLFDLGPLDTHPSRAALAWEVAACWQLEPDRARALAHHFTD